MNMHKTQKFLTILLLMIFVSACSSPAAATPTGETTITSASMADIIAQYRQTIRQMMQQNQISGVAIAVVDGQNILWEEGFGYTDGSQKIPITPDTLFSIQSMSKSFTASAVMFAAQDGLVDLDAPITTYLPDFHVNSLFEEHPEQKMTLRILLSHTAGFPLEAPYGNNYDPPGYSFERHIASISDTWLRFPVGTRYNYSNLDVDLAGYILQVRSGLPFIQYVQEKVMAPLGMNNSTLDVNLVRANPTRAIGYGGADIRPPLDLLIIPSGGVWSTAADMARYLQFHINKGAMNGERLLAEDLAETMYTPPNAAARNIEYALGVTVDTRNGARHFQHGGGGFGFTNSMAWYPELQLGAVVLTNKPDNSWCVDLNEAVLDSIISSNPGLYAQRTASAVLVAPAYPPSQGETILWDAGLQSLIAGKALPTDAAAIRRRAAYAGTYYWKALIVPPITVQVMDNQGQLSIEYQDETGPLTEVEPGLFFTPGGDTFDVRGATPSIRNVAMVKADPQVKTLKTAFYALCGLVFLSTLLFWPVRALFRRFRRVNSPVSSPDGSGRQGYRLAWTGILAGVASLFGLVCLGLVALIPNLVFVSWPHPYPDLLWWQAALLCLPFAGLFLGAVIALLAGMAFINHAWGRMTRFYYILAAAAFVAFNFALIV